jgi:methylglutaconyl-CoA hydratase
MTTDPTTGSVSTTTDGVVATITFGHPKGNSLPSALLNRLAAALREVSLQHEVSVVVLRSAEPGPFCAGASFDELQAITSEADGKEFFSGFARVILAMIECPKFIIARVHGKVAGGGVGLVCAADYAIASESAALRLSELAVGIGPFVVGPVIQHKVGPAHYSAMSVDFDWRDAAWGLRTGMYVRVVPPNELDGEVAALSTKLAAANPLAMAELKRVFWEGTTHWKSLLLERAAVSGRLVLSEHTRRAIAAFGAK